MWGEVYLGVGRVEKLETRQFDARDFEYLLFFERWHVH
jgi:hypothetical protein